MDDDTMMSFDTDNTPMRTGRVTLDEFDLIPNDFDYESLDMSHLLEPPFPMQFGGGKHRDPTPEVTPTRLRTRINPSLRGQGSTIVDNAKTRRAQMAPEPEAPLLPDRANDASAQHQYPPSRTPSHDIQASVGSTKMHGQLQDPSQDLDRQYLVPPHANDGRYYIGPGILPVAYSHPTEFVYADHPQAQFAHDYRHLPSRGSSDTHSRRPSPSVPSQYDHRLEHIIPHEERPDNYFASKSSLQSISYSNRC
jgi:hypothetical protein